MIARFLLMAVVVLQGEGEVLAAPTHLPFISPIVLSETELDVIHAGYSDPSGVSVSLGAVMKSYVDGNLILASTMTLNTSGLSITEELSGGALPLTQVQGAGFQSVPQGSATLLGIGGETTFLHTISDLGVSNVVLNSANGRNIVQTTAVTITIPNLETLQQQAALVGLATGLHDMVGSSLLQATSH